MTTEVKFQALGELARQGFTLEYPDDHVLILIHEGVAIAIFSQTGATPMNLQGECFNHLATKHSWSGWLWVVKEI